LELLDPYDRKIIVLRQWEGLSYQQIASELEVTPEAARMRHNRAVGRLSEQIGALRRQGCSQDHFLGFDCHDGEDHGAEEAGD